MADRRGFLFGLVAVGITANVGRRLYENSQETDSGLDRDTSSDSTDSDSSYINEESNINTEPEQDDERSLEEKVEDSLEEEEAEPVEEPETISTILNQSNRRIAGGEYLYWGFELTQTVELELRTTVRNGPNVDVIVTDPREFTQFERGNRFRFYNISQENTVGDDTTDNLGPGEYVVFIYNRDHSTSTVDIELTATG